MLILKIFQIQKQIRKGVFDTRDFAIEEAMGYLKGFRNIFYIILIPLMVVPLVFGFTDWIAGPFGFAKFLFWFFLTIFLLGIFIFNLVYKNIKKGLEGLI